MGKVNFPVSKNETFLELSSVLKQDFVCFGGKGSVLEHIRAYLSSR